MKKPERLGDAPIESEFIRMMNTIAGVLDEAFNGEARGTDRKTGFVLIAFPFAEAAAAKAGGTGRANYISNATRDDVVIMLKEQIRRFEGQPEASGRA